MSPASILIYTFGIMGLVWPVILQGQRDSLVLSNGNILVGEIKAMENSVLVMKTPFSKSDFSIKWKEVKEIYTANNYLITLADGNWMRSNLQSSQDDGIYILGQDDLPFRVTMEDIVYLKELKQGVWSRVTANIDIGVNLTKANNQRQLNFQTRLGYLTERFGLGLYYEDYRTRQDSVAPITRKEGGFDLYWFLQDDWYILPQLGYLSNTEQALRSRISPNVGAGRFLIRNNSYYWGVMGGVNLNYESFTNETSDRRSAELFVSTGVNLFDLGDLDLTANVAVYPSLTEKGRVRSDAKFNTRFEFFEDFYIRVNLTYNYDNQPAISGNESDYVFGVSFGWEKD